MNTVQKGNPNLALLTKESAAKFISIVEKKFALSLDFSEASLYIADLLITLFFKERRDSELAAGLIGSYLGEVVISNLGGRWDPSDLSITKIGQMKGTAYPFRQAKERLQKGLGQACTSWYADLKMKYCRSGDFLWDGHASTHFYECLVAQGWDLRLLNRLADEEEKPYIREEAAHVLRELKSKRSIPALLKGLNCAQHAYFACIAFQGIKDPRALPALRNLSRNNNEMAIRIQAIQALGEQRDVDSVPLLLQMLDEEDIIAHYASQALAKVGGKDVLESLMQLLKRDDAGKKILALSALELLGDHVCVPALIENLFDRSDEVREAAARALQYIPDKRALEPLLLLLGDPSSRIKILAAYALTFLGDHRALEPIRKLLKDPVKDVRDHVSYLIPLLETSEQPCGFCW